VELGTSSQNGARLLLVGAPFRHVPGSSEPQEGVAYAFEREGDAFVEKWTLRAFPTHSEKADGHRQPAKPRRGAPKRLGKQRQRRQNTANGKRGGRPQQPYRVWR